MTAVAEHRSEKFTTRGTAPTPHTTHRLQFHVSLYSTLFVYIHTYTPYIHARSLVHSVPSVECEPSNLQLPVYRDQSTRLLLPLHHSLFIHQ
jgi:hypothetical protein